MLDIVRLCTERKVPFLLSGHHHCKVGWVQMHCPKCAGGLQGWHLGFNLERGNFHCWRCGSIKTTEVLSGLLRLSHPADVYAVIEQYQKTGPILPSGRSHKLPNQLRPPPGLTPIRLVHRAYLRMRGFRPAQLVRNWELQGTTFESGAWNWRVVYPIRDIDGRIVAWQGRAIHADAQPRYKTTSAHEMLVDAKTLIYGIHCVPGDAVVIVEGAADVWRLGPGAVASLGIGWKHQQINRLRGFNRRYLLFDPDLAAQRRATEAANHLSLFGGTTEIISGFATDPGDMPQHIADRLMRRLGIGGRR